MEDNDINKSGLTNYRKNSVSTIFQAYNLMTYMTARQNVPTALEISNKPVDNAKIEELFELVGIPQEMEKRYDLKPISAIRAISSL